jgi:hypothetical protein
MSKKSKTEKSASVGQDGWKTPPYKRSEYGEQHNYLLTSNPLSQGAAALLEAFKAGGAADKKQTRPDLHQPGAKDDQNKLRSGLVLGEFANALEKVCEVGTYGAKKYTPRGWLSVPDAEERYLDALVRHLLAHMQGIELDEESHLTHLSHAAWNVLALLELRDRGVKHKQRRSDHGRTSGD